MQKNINSVILGNVEKNAANKSLIKRMLKQKNLIDLGLKKLKKEVIGD